METSRHIHHREIKLFAEDAANNKDPWSLWEVSGDGMFWESIQASSALWNPELIYRRKLGYIKVNGTKVSAPINNYPENGTPIYIVDFNLEGNVSQDVWNSGYTPTIYVDMGITHLTREAAALHAEALLSTEIWKD